MAALQAEGNLVTTVTPAAGGLQDTLSRLPPRLPRCVPAMVRTSCTSTHELPSPASPGPVAQAHAHAPACQFMTMAQ